LPESLILPGFSPYLLLQLPVLGLFLFQNQEFRDQMKTQGDRTIFFRFLARFMRGFSYFPMEMSHVLVASTVQSPVPYFEQISEPRRQTKSRKHRLCVTDRVDWIDPRSPFLGLKTLVMVESERAMASGKKNVERHCFLSSLPPGAERLGQKIRAHWVLDMAFNENPCRIRAGYAAENMVIIRRFAVNLLKRDTPRKLGIKNKRLRMAYDTDYRNLILFGSAKPSKNNAKPPRPWGSLAFPSKKGGALPILFCCLNRQKIGGYYLTTLYPIVVWRERTSLGRARLVPRPPRNDVSPCLA
jgi:predicted transposase YbfD/YdcC